MPTHVRELTRAHSDTVTAMDIRLPSEIDIRLVGLTARDEEQLRSAYPRPGMPLVVRPGSHPDTGPLVPNPEDPAYLRAAERWNARMRRLVIAASMNLAVGGEGGVDHGTWDTARDRGDAAVVAWADLADKGIANAMSTDVVLSLYEIVIALGNPMRAKRLEEARGNLSAGGSGRIPLGDLMEAFTNGTKPNKSESSDAPPPPMPSTPSDTSDSESVNAST